jgi:uncharacterized coiled-coil DUF342 family protein
VKDKEDEVLSRFEEMQQWKSKYNDLEASTRPLHIEVETLRRQIYNLTSETDEVRLKLQQQGPRLAELEPELLELREERRAWLQEKIRLEGELRQCRRSQKLLNAVNSELAVVKRTEGNRGEESFEFDGGDRRVGDERVLSEKHIAWTEISAISDLCPALDKKVRELLHDLRSKEEECSALHQEVASFKKEVNDKTGQVRQLKEKLRSLEGEGQSNQCAKGVLDRLKAVLKAFPFPSMDESSSYSSYSSAKVPSREPTEEKWNNVSTVFHQYPLQSLLPSIPV